MLLLLLALQIAASAVTSEPISGAEAANSRELPLQIIRIGPVRPLPTASAASATGDKSTGFVPVVSARSVMLRNNITISQSRIVLSRLDQLFLLQRLLDLIDLAPKLTGTAAIEAAEHEEKLVSLDEDATAQGFLFDLAAFAELDSEADVAIADVGGTTLGFGWRYPLAYWNKLDARKRPKCGVGIIVGRYYYC